MFARRHGYVKSLSGRKRRLPEARGSDDQARKQAERQAINSPVQSFANELNLMCLLQLSREFGRSNVRICGTVHDAVLFRVRNPMVRTVARRYLEIARHPALLDTLEVDIKVPLEAEASIGPWGAGISIDKWKEPK
jgi:DNA polymerase-1